MSTLASGVGTLLDIQKQLDPNGAPARIIESLTRNSPILNDIPWMPTNGADSHLVTTRTGLPKPTWVKYNQGVTPVKGVTDQFTETCGRAEARISIDKALAQRKGAEAYKTQQVSAVIEGMRQEVATGLFYHSTKTAPEKFMGLSPRLDALSGIPYSGQIIPHTGSPSGNDQMSIWLIGWGLNTVHGIYPQGTTAGITHTPLKEDYEDDGAGGKYLAERAHLSWQCGLAVEDARYVVRIANIDYSALAGTGKTIIDAMIDALERINSLEGCTPIFYMNRTLRAFLRKQVNDTAKNTLTVENVAGKQQLMFSEVPIHREDALLTTEAPLT